MRGTGWFTIPLFFLNIGVMQLAHLLLQGEFANKNDHQTALTVMVIASLILAWIEFGILGAMFGRDR